MTGYWQLNGYVLFLIATTILLFLIAVLVWKRRHAPGAVYLVGLMAAGGFWSLVYAAQLGFRDLEGILLWARLRYLWIAGIPPLWYLFARHYTEQSNEFKPKLLAVLAVEYVLCNLVIWSPFGDLFMTAIGLVPEKSVVFIDFTYGPFFWVHSAYSYLLMMAGTVQLLKTLWNRRDVYRGQLGMLVVGMLTPWIGNILSIFELLPTPEFDITPFGLLITGTVMMLGLYRFRLLDLLPVALETIFENMNEGVLVLDSELRIIDSNPALKRILGNERVLSAGCYIGEIVPEIVQLVAFHHAKSGWRDELNLELGGKRRTFDTHVSSLDSNRSTQRGWLVSLHEITKLKESEAALREQARQIGILNEISFRANQPGNFGGLVQQMANQVLKLMEADACRIIRRTPDGSNTVLGEDFLSSEWLGIAPVLSEIEENLVSHVLSTSGQVHREEKAVVSKESGLQHKSDVVTFLGFPMLSGEEKLGAVIVCCMNVPAFSEETLQICDHAVEQISLAVARALLLEELEERVQDRTAALEQANQDLEAEVRQRSYFEQELSQKAKALELSQQDIIWRLANAGEFRDNETGNHVVRVGYYSWLIAQQLQLSEEFCRMIFLTSPLHDIGKIGIPDEILLKPDILTETERKLMKDHCLIGANILMSDPGVLKPPIINNSPQLPMEFTRLGSANPFIEMAASIALSHHEHWDGKGYPMELVGGAIPTEARIVAVADVFDALTSRRRYKPAYSIDKSVGIIRDLSGSHFDPAVVYGFLNTVDDCVAIGEQYSD